MRCHFVVSSTSFNFLCLFAFLGIITCIPCNNVGTWTGSNHPSGGLHFVRLALDSRPFFLPFLVLVLVGLHKVDTVTNRAMICHQQCFRKNLKNISMVNISEIQWVRSLLCTLRVRGLITLITICKSCEEGREVEEMQEWYWKNRDLKT